MKVWAIDFMGEDTPPAVFNEGAHLMFDEWDLIATPPYELGTEPQRQRFPRWNVRRYVVTDN